MHEESMHTEYHETIDGWALVQAHDANPYTVRVTGQETAAYDVAADAEFAINVRRTDTVEIVQNGHIINVVAKEQ